MNEKMAQEPIKRISADQLKRIKAALEVIRQKQEAMAVARAETRSEVREQPDNDFPPVFSTRDKAVSWLLKSSKLTKVGNDNVLLPIDEAEQMARGYPPYSDLNYSGFSRATDILSLGNAGVIVGNSKAQILRACQWFFLRTRSGPCSRAILSYSEGIIRGGILRVSKVPGQVQSGSFQEL